MKFLLLLILLQATSTFAETKKSKKSDDKKMLLLGTINADGIKNMEPTKPAAENTDKPLESSKFKMTCKDKAGKEFKEKETGYEACLADLNNNYNANQMKGTDKKNPADANSAGFNYQIGN